MALNSMTVVTFGTMADRLLAQPRNTHPGTDGIDDYLIVECPSELTAEVVGQLRKANVVVEVEDGQPIEGRGGLDTLTISDDEPGAAQRILDRFKKDQFPEWFLES